MEEKNINGKRFIAAYNRLDQGLRDIYSIKRSLTFSDMIRKVATVNTVVRKFEEDLIDYGRLRNAIVHKSSDEIIAEPNIEVVEKIEKIARLINTPPKVIESLKPRKVFSVMGDTTLKEVVSEMFKCGYSVVPVYIKGTLVGVINRKMIVDAVGKIIMQGKDIDESINEPVSKSIDIFTETSHYEVAPSSLTIENLLYMFQQNRKLSSVILTENGNYSEPAKAVIVSADIIDLNSILDNY
jgi:predicted transcriptional regulator